MKQTVQKDWFAGIRLCTTGTQELFHICIIKNNFQTALSCRQLLGILPAQAYKSEM